MKLMIFILIIDNIKNKCIQPIFIWEKIMFNLIGYIVTFSYHNNTNIKPFLVSIWSFLDNEKNMGQIYLYIYIIEKNIEVYFDQSINLVFYQFVPFNFLFHI